MADLSTGQVGVVYPKGHAKETAAKSDHMNAATMLYLYNDSGGDLVSGDVGFVDTDGKVSTTTSAGKAALIVVVATNIDGTSQTVANGAQGWFQCCQYCPAVKVDGATTIGQWLTTSTTVKKATPSADTEPPEGTFGIALSAASDEVAAYLSPGFGWGYASHRDATSNVHGTGSGNYVLGTKHAAALRVEYVQITKESVGGSGQYEQAFTWANAFTTLYAAVATLNCTTDQGNDLSDYGVSLEEVGISGGNCLYRVDKAGDYTIDIIGIGV